MIEGIETSTRTSFVEVDLASLPGVPMTPPSPSSPDPDDSVPSSPRHGLRPGTTTSSTAAPTCSATDRPHRREPAVSSSAEAPPGVNSTRAPSDNQGHASGHCSRRCRSNIRQLASFKEPAVPQRQLCPRRCASATYRIIAGAGLAERRTQAEQPPAQATTGQAPLPRRPGTSGRIASRCAVTTAVSHVDTTASKAWNRAAGD